MIGALAPAGITVVEAEDGEQALALMRSERPDAVVLDINMPKMSGIEVVEAVRTEGAKPPPIVMLTTEVEPSLIRRAKEAGAVGWIVKPFRADALVETLKKVTKA